MRSRAPRSQGRPGLYHGDAGVRDVQDPRRSLTARAGQPRASGIPHRRRDRAICGSRACSARVTGRCSGSTGRCVCVRSPTGIASISLGTPSTCSAPESSGPASQVSTTTQPKRSAAARGPRDRTTAPRLAWTRRRPAKRGAARQKRRSARRNETRPRSKMAGDAKTPPDARRRRPARLDAARARQNGRGAAKKAELPRKTARRCTKERAGCT